MSAKNLLCFAGLLVGGIFIVWLLFPGEKDPRYMDVNELNGLLDKYVKMDTSDGYLRAAYIRDLIAAKQVEVQAA